MKFSMSAKSYHREISKRLLKTSIKTYSRTSKSGMAKKQTLSIPKSFVKDATMNPIVYNNSSDISYLFPVVTLLEKLNIKYEVMPDSHVKQNCLFMQDKFMNDFYKYYPEYVCFDALCEIPELDYTVTLFIGLDTNGHCEIVSVGLIKSGNLEGFSWFCEVFKKHNPQWNRTEFIASDLSSYREILAEAFPSQPVFISFFHSMKAFKKDLSNLDPAVSSHDIQKALQVFEQMIFVNSDSGYSELLKQMKQMPAHIFPVFKKNWHVIKKFWTIGIYFDSKMFLKAFNSYLLSMRLKLKAHITSQESLENVIKILHLVIVKLRREYFQKFTCMFQNPLVTCKKLNVIQKYAKYLTPYATELINEQLSLSENMKNVQKINQNKYVVNGNETVVSFKSCGCSFHALMMLPCCHLFSVRNFLSLPLYVESLRSSWTLAEYHTSFLNLYSSFISNDQNEQESIKKLERFSQYIQVSHEMWNLLFNCSEEVSQERLETFQNVLKAWKNNFKVGVQVIEKQSNSSCSNGEALSNLSTDHFKEMYGISLNDILDSENDFSSVSLCSESGNDLL